MWDLSSSDQGSNLCPMHYEALNLNQWTTRQVPVPSFIFVTTFLSYNSHIIPENLSILNYIIAVSFRTFTDYASNTLMNFRTHSSSQRTLYPSSVSLQFPSLGNHCAGYFHVITWLDHNVPGYLAKHYCGCVCKGISGWCWHLNQ